MRKSCSGDLQHLPVNKMRNYLYSRTPSCKTHDTLTLAISASSTVAVGLKARSLEVNSARDASCCVSEGRGSNSSSTGSQL